MKKRLAEKVRLIATGVLVTAILAAFSQQALVVRADKIQDIQNQINNTQNQINEINDRIDDLTDEQDLVEEMIADLNAEILNTMTSIGMKEDEIAEKEAELSLKQEEIDVTEAEYDAAKEKAEQQYDDMVTHTRVMYERGDSTYLTLFLLGGGLSDLLNRMDYVEKIYVYDRNRLDEYQKTQQLVLELWNRLEEEKAQLEQDKANLEQDREALKAQRVELDAMLAKRKAESANYEAEIAKAKQEAAVAKKQLQQEQKLLKQEQQKQAASNAANATYASSDYSSVIDNASGSELGKQVARFACQFIGNPYVYGGTSLTEGADCSGFTYRVYQNFGYNLPRTSSEQRNAGTGVSYSDAQPGDLICYSGHVAIYIGGGKIVHASTEKTGIKVSNAAYREILAVRRIV